MITKLSGIPRWKTHAVDLHEGGCVQLPMRTVGHEALVQVQDGVLIIPGVHHNKLHISLGQPVLAALVTHDGGDRTGCI